ncbi:MAG: hypothetical protein Q4F21_12470 [Lachnospiraceae bacterium]|nr:hypothetical protein [Lachnospiraceae bacterium]
MCEVLDRVENKGIEKGIAKGENTAFSLVQYLISNNRMEDLKKASEDVSYRNKLMAEIFPKNA